MIGESYESAVEVTRGDLVESVHAAAVAVADASGRLLGSLGDPGLRIYLRSSAKPFQAAAVVLSGAADRFGFTDDEIAVMAGSHAGEPAHVAAVTSMLGKAGIDPSAMGCGAHSPFHRSTAEALVRAGRRPTVLMNNCSGKHAGMLAAAKAGGHPLEGYLDPEHPVQRANRAAVSLFAGRPESEIRTAVDGCTAPTFAVSLEQAARAFARLVSSEASSGGLGPLGPAAARVARAMRAHPPMVAGEGMLDTELMRLVPGLVAKVGADGVHAMGWPSPRGPIGVALKIMDGDVGRGRTAVVFEALRQIGAIDASAPLPASLAPAMGVLNHNRISVGVVRPAFTLHRPA